METFRDEKLGVVGFILPGQTAGWTYGQYIMA